MVHVTHIIVFKYELSNDWLISGMLILSIFINPSWYISTTDISVSFLMLVDHAWKLITIINENYFMHFCLRIDIIVYDHWL